MSEAEELRRAILMERLDAAERILHRARQSGQIPPTLAAQIETYLAMARWETTPDKETLNRLKAIASVKL